ncbi:MAG TPA: GFA family protein [Myxococcales bacterium]|nr:GFA family protein [Myxococcales bacterium]
MVVRLGGCHCGAVRYDLAGDLGLIVNCYCRDCRRAHGSAFSTVTLVSNTDFRVCAGEESVREYQAGTGSRFFCERCGGQLFNRAASMPGLTTLVIATLDKEPIEPPRIHINVESKAPWYEILDGRPEFQALPPVHSRR